MLNFFVVELKDYDFDLVQNLPLLLVSILKQLIDTKTADTFHAVRV